MLTERPTRENFLGRVAVADADGRWTYRELLRQAERFRDSILAAAGADALLQAGDETGADWAAGASQASGVGQASRAGQASGAGRPAPGAALAGERIAFLVPPGRRHVAVQWGAWRAGGIAVPLAVSHPPRELEHVLDDAKPRIVVADPSLPHAEALLGAAEARGAATLLVGAETLPAHDDSCAHMGDVGGSLPVGAERLLAHDHARAHMGDVGGSLPVGTERLLAHDDSCAHMGDVGGSLPVGAETLPAHDGSRKASDRSRGPDPRRRSARRRSGTSGPARGPEPTAPSSGPAPGDGALVVYTSGTTGRPKGVLSTHANVAAQCRALVAAWGWSRDDRILHVLPLHHIHGIVNALCCALWSGATCEFGDPAPVAVWERLASGEVTLFMAVPTVYGRLIRAWEAAPSKVQRRWSRGARRTRLMVSGSAALPVPTFKRWREITGHALLERYGMTEIGMALSNPLAGKRRPGGVGQPLPGVQLRLVDNDGRPAAGDSGQIAVRGPQVFKEYWGRPRETAAAFRDGWFLTGDEARLENGSYRILGRRSVDVLKTGGYKVSALEVEEQYRAHPAVRDVAVVGATDPEWGQRICAAWTPARARDASGLPAPALPGGPVADVAEACPDDAPGLPTPAPPGGKDRSAGREASRSPDSAAGSAACPKPALPSAAELRAWGKERLAPYKVPREFLMMDRLPRNAMGKVRKPALVSIFNAGPPGSSCSG